MNRRDYLQKFMLGGTVLFLAPSVLQSCSKDEDADPGENPGPPAPGKTIDVDLTDPANAALNNPGGSKIIQSILVANTGANFIAVSSICTHEGCTVGYSAEKIQCPCHGSQFNTTGSVLQGPATTPLQSYGVTKTGNTLKIST